MDRIDYEIGRAEGAGPSFISDLAAAVCDLVHEKDLHFKIPYLWDTKAECDGVYDAREAKSGLPAEVDKKPATKDKTPPK